MGEFIGAIFVMVIVYGGIALIIELLSSLVRAVVPSRSSALQIRLIDKTIPAKKATRAKLIEIRGAFPITERTNLGMVTSLYDITESNQRAPLFSFIDDLQEELTHAYQHKSGIWQYECGLWRPRLG